ncbi:hypothetical protein ASF57_15680 [Methylobacterium sp. Leaf117]|nr:hypothetical protein ASF57_15680 [Methylobacterium sp. Leaf117]
MRGRRRGLITRAGTLDGGIQIFRIECARDEFAAAVGYVTGVTQPLVADLIRPGADILVLGSGSRQQGSDQKTGCKADDAYEKRILRHEVLDCRLAVLEASTAAIAQIVDPAKSFPVRFRSPSPCIIVHVRGALPKILCGVRQTIAGVARRGGSPIPKVACPRCGFVRHGPFIEATRMDTVSLRSRVMARARDVVQRSFRLMAARHPCGESDIIRKRTMLVAGFLGRTHGKLLMVGDGL